MSVHRFDDIIEEPELQKKQEIAKNTFMRILMGKTQFCKHRNTCMLNALKGFIMNFWYGYGINTIIKVLFLLRLGKKGLKKIPYKIFASDSFSLGMFMGSLIGIYKSVLWTLRTIRNKEDSKNAITAGMICALSALCDQDRSRRVIIICYVLARVLEVTLKVLDSK